MKEGVNDQKKIKLKKNVYKMKGTVCIHICPVR